MIAQERATTKTLCLNLVSLPGFNGFANLGLDRKGPLRVNQYPIRFQERKFFYRLTLIEYCRTKWKRCNWKLYSYFDEQKPNSTNTYLLPSYSMVQNHGWCRPLMNRRVQFSIERFCVRSSIGKLGYSRPWNELLNDIVIVQGIKWPSGRGHAGLLMSFIWLTKIQLWNFTLLEVEVEEDLYFVRPIKVLYASYILVHVSFIMSKNI